MKKNNKDKKYYPITVINPNNFKITVYSKVSCVAAIPIREEGHDTREEIDIATSYNDNKKEIKNFLSDFILNIIINIAEK